MAQRSHVPKFGNWESEENVPYTAYFDKARKGRVGGKLINPNDPEDKPDLVSAYSAPTQASPVVRDEPEGQAGNGAGRQLQDRRRSREDSEFSRYAESPARHDSIHRRGGNETVPQRYSGRGGGPGETYRRPARQSGGSENSMERSPLHPHARIAAKSSGASPVWEGKNYDSSHGTPGRSRMRPRGDESPDKSAAVPKFGEWDENNPASADGYSYIFNKVREERQAGMAAGVATKSPHANIRKQPPSESSKSCCFPWCRS
ncbi:hypothetical protein K2173_018260 [Erythroxylum novogranatense]|uniref:RIN4 pathogenic type III effector avirulence factor Avr cleavage site domain-containing protein n=1 Tax=Erythroxylum novogranatense TaxID=1862640 RepID=A0AAV8UA44_9ROSI|nr:hypothetical protein K2173_018260 [Erythroxylum novogranatense]